MREMCLLRLDKTRPAVVLTHKAACAAMTKFTIAPITYTLRALSSEVPGQPCGLDHDGVIPPRQRPHRFEQAAWSDSRVSNLRTRGRTHPGDRPGLRP